MTSPILQSAYRVAVSAFILFVLVFQFIVSMGPVVGIKLGTNFWPIVTYAMYSKSFREGDTVNIYKLLEGVSEDGSTIEISMDDLHLHLWHYRNLIRDLENGSAEAKKFVLDSVVTDSPLIKVRIKNFPVQVSRDGPVEQPSKVLSTVSLISDGVDR